MHLEAGAYKVQSIQPQDVSSTSPHHQVFTTVSTIGLGNVQPLFTCLKVNGSVWLAKNRRCTVCSRERSYGLKSCSPRSWNCSDLWLVSALHQSVSYEKTLPCRSFSRENRQKSRYTVLHSLGRRHFNMQSKDSWLSEEPQWKPQHPARTVQGRLTEHIHKDLSLIFWQGQTWFFHFVFLWPSLNREQGSLPLGDAYIWFGDIKPARFWGCSCPIQESSKLTLWPSPSCQFSHDRSSLLSIGMGPCEGQKRKISILPCLLDQQLD